MKTIVALTPPQLCDGRIAIAACRAGELGIVDLSSARNDSAIHGSLSQMMELTPSGASWGIRWDLCHRREHSLSALKGFFQEPAPCLLLGGCPVGADLELLLREARTFAERVFLEASCLADALSGQAAGFDGVILKGYESGGYTSHAGSFVLLQQVHGKLEIPYWIQGGMGLHTTAAALAAGARGVVLCEHFWLTEESPFSHEEKRKWLHMDGSETLSLDLGRECFRCHCGSQPDRVRKMEELACSAGDRSSEVAHHVNVCTDGAVVPMGQDIAFAAHLAKRYATVGRILTAVRSCAKEYQDMARRKPLFSRESPLARTHGTRYPFVQGPMARISDVPSFLAAVAREGALPFLALSLLTGESLHRLLLDTQNEMKGKPWGVGILGFLPQELRQEQVKALSQVSPPFAIIAGGRPSQAAELESLGISAYLHVPSPNLLRLFLKEGARKFIFEGKECGGHVGPRTSCVLWEAMAEVLLGEKSVKSEELQILFAGGIHDGLSAAMVNVIAAPLAARGMKVGLQMGTVYLFTREAVTEGAIKEEYQKQVLSCDSTVLLESGKGHACRCVKTPFVDEFLHFKKELVGRGTADEKIRRELELLNLGRLRTAAKGVKRAQGEHSSCYVEVDEETQRCEGMYMIGQVAELRREPTTLAQLHTRIASEHESYLRDLPGSLEEPPALSSASGNRDIAIVGMACMFPHASDVREYWQNILNRVVAVTEVCGTRWESSHFYTRNRLERDKSYSKWGGFLKDVAFDPLKYGIPPISLRSIDPIQLLALETAWKALEDAGFHSRGFPRETTSTFFGVGGAQDRAIAYSFRAMLPHFLRKSKEVDPDVAESVIASLHKDLPIWTKDSFPGVLDNVVAGRISNRLDLGGGNCTADAACASSFAALDMGVRQLQAHACDVALVGAVDGTNNLVGYICFSRSQAFSPDGRCRPFDDGAEGMVIGEGVGALVLRRLCDAERDGDRIYAVIKGIGSSSDGRNRSLSAPHAAGQAKALQRAYADARLSPRTVELVEAHGTGTAVGDKVEIQALTEVFGAAESGGPYCAIGSVKSMIGHTKVVSGMASLIKSVLALKHKVFPPTVGVEVPNRAIDVEKSPFFINTELRPWFRGEKDKPRRVGVSAFGFGGSNYHVVLEEYDGDLRESARLDYSPRDVELLCLTRENRQEIVKVLSRLMDVLAKAPQVPLASFVRAVFEEERAVRRTGKGEGSPCRLAIVARSAGDLHEKLRKSLDHLHRWNSRKDGGALPEGLYFREGDKYDGKVCFLFPGQGAQKLNMLRDLVAGHPCVHHFFEKGDAILAGCHRKPLSRYIFPFPVFSPEDRKRQKDELDDTHVAQPAIGLTNLAALEILRNYGLTPHMVAGHSYGEYVALHAARVLSLEDLVRLSELRGRIVKEVCRSNPGTMAAVRADARMTTEAVSGLGLRVFAANCNAPNQTIIAGRVKDVENAVKVFMENGIAAKQIPVCAPFHTPLMREACELLGDELKKVSLQSPAVPVYSNTTTNPYPSDPEKIRQLLLDHLHQPVLFEDQVHAMYRAGGRLFIEVGPGRILTGLVDRILQGRDHTAVPIDGAGRPAWFQLAHVLGRCHVLGLDVRWEQWFMGRRLPQTTTSELLKSVEKDLNPPKHVVRLNTYLVEPWSESASEASCTTESSLAVPERPARKAATNLETFGEENGSDLPVNEWGKESSQQMVGPSVKRREHEELELNGPVEMKHPMKKTQQTEETPKATSPAEGIAAPQREAIPLFHSITQQFIELQREQQKVMHRFLDIQERVLEASLGNGSPSSYPIVQEQSPVPGIKPSVIVGSVPPAPVLPKLVPSPGPIPAAPSPQEETSPAATSGSGVFGDLENSKSPGKGESASRMMPRQVPTAEEFQENLLRLVSERTGYPIEMLDMDSHMEADLGIDSIKKVEIFAHMSEEYEVMKSLEQETLLEQLAEVTTLRGIVDWYAAGRCQFLERPGATISAGSREPFQKEEAASTERETSIRTEAGASQETPGFEGPPQPAPSDQEAKMTCPDPKVVDPVKRYVLEPVLTPLDSSPQEWFMSSSPPLHVLCVVPRKQAVEQARGFLPKPLVPVFVWPGEGSEEAAENAFEMDFSSIDALERLRKRLAGSGRTMGGLFNFLSLDGVLDERGELSKVNDTTRIKDFFLLLKTFREDLVQAGEKGMGLLVHLSTMDGRFGLKRGGGLFVADAGAAGMLKSVAKEWHGVKVKTIDLDPLADLAFLQERVRDELKSSDKLVEVGIDEEGRWRLVHRACARDTKVQSLLPINSASVILLLGGGRGITAEVAKGFAVRYRPHLVLVGRSFLQETEDPEFSHARTTDEIRHVLVTRWKAGDVSLTPAAIDARVRAIEASRELRQNMDWIRSAGAQVEYRSMDVCREEALEELIDDLYERYGRIDGVVHGAGISEDKLVRDKTPESFSKVLDTKVVPAVVLSRKLRLESLKFMVFFSSVAGRFGNAGQCDYSAANQVLNQVAVYFHHVSPGRVLSINWGPWDSGMVQGAVKRYFAEKGVNLIPTQVGVKMFFDELHSSGSRFPEVLISRDLKRFEQE